MKGISYIYSLSMKRRNSIRFSIFKINISILMYPMCRGENQHISPLLQM